MRYSLDITELLPLKAFYLGFSLKEHVDNHVDLLGIIDTVDESIERCGESESLQTRKAFYLLLKCELTRDTASVTRNREIAKNFCDETDHVDFFHNYMKIVNATLQPKKVVGGGAMSTIKQEEISHKEVRYVPKYHGVVEIGVEIIEYELPLEALDLRKGDLSEKDYKFLYEVTLKEILDRHSED